MKVLYVGDNRNRGNYGCRATSIALSLLIREKCDIVGTISGKATSSDISKLFFFERFPKIVYTIFKNHPFLKEIFKQIIIQSKAAFLFGKKDFISANFCKSIKNLKKCLPSNIDLQELNLDQYDFDAIIVNGEGSFIFSTPAWREPLVLSMIMHWALEKNKKVFLVNAMFSDSPISERNQTTIKAIQPILEKCQQVIVREQTSFNYIKNNFQGISVKIVPDAIFNWYNTISEIPPITNGRLIIPHLSESDESFSNLDFTQPYIIIAGSSCYVGNQKESIPAYTSLTEQLKKKYSGNIYLIQTCEGDEFLKKVSANTKTPLISLKTPLLAAAKILSEAQAFITGRYHPAILASLGGTPCIFMDSNSHKTLSIQDVLQYDNPKEYHAIPSHDEINSIIEETFNVIKQGPSLRNRIKNRCKDLSSESKKIQDFFIK